MLRLRGRLAAGLVTLMIAALALSGCAESSEKSTGAPNRAGSNPTGTTDHQDETSEHGGEPDQGDTWADYLWSGPGDGCTLSPDPSVTTVYGNTIRVSTASAQRLVSRTGSAKKPVYLLRTVNTITSTESDPPPGSLAKDVDRETLLLRYQLNDDGTLSFLPQTVTSMGTHMKVTKGAQIYPSLEQAQAGESITRDADMEVVPAPGAPAEALRELRQLTSDGSTNLRYRLTYQVSGIPTQQVGTPFGTFTDVVGLKLQTVGMKALNARPGGSDGNMQNLTQALSPQASTWFARGTGIVQVTTRSMMGFTSVARAVECTGASGFGPPTTGAKNDRRDSASTLTKARVIKVPDSANGAAFVSPSGNITCLITDEDAGGTARCDIAEYAYDPPARPNSCPADFGSSFEVSTTAIPLCIGDTIVGTADTTGDTSGSNYVSWFDSTLDSLAPRVGDPSGKKTQASLAYGDAITYRSIRCESAETGMTCRNTATGASVSLAKGGYRLNK